MSLRLLRNHQKTELRAGNVINFVRIGSEEAVKQAKSAKCIVTGNFAKRRDFGRMLISEL
jgi:hypothetical protein